MYIQHRNTQKRLPSKGASYFVTSKTFHNYPYFKNPLFCEIFLANLKLCKELKKFRLYAWVLMYDHIHLLLEPNANYNLPNIIHFIKRNTSRDINKIVKSSYLEGAFPQRRLSKIKNVGELPGPDVDLQYFKWQKSYHDHYIRNQKDFDSHWNYIKLNPIKSEDMPNDWRYVSGDPTIEDICDRFFEADF